MVDNVKGRWIECDAALTQYAQQESIDISLAKKRLATAMSDGDVRARGLKPNDSAYDVFEIPEYEEGSIIDRWSTEQAPRRVDSSIFLRAIIDWDEGDVYVNSARLVANLEIDRISLDEWIDSIANGKKSKGGRGKKI